LKSEIFEVQTLSEFEYLHRQVIGCVVVSLSTHAVMQDEAIESSLGGSTELPFAAATTAHEASDTSNSMAK
jgi:hypothetical protein